MTKDKQPEGTLAGTYQATGRGFGFFVPDGEAGRESDYFIPPRAEGGAWHGDRVAALPDGEIPGQGERRTARITAVLERHNRVVTGVLRRQGREIWLFPDGGKLPGPIQVVGKARRLREGEKAAVAVTSFGNAKHPPLGVLRETFGRDGTREAATAALLYHYEIDRTFPDAAAAQAQAIPGVVDPSALEGRLDLRDKIIFTIDGASAKDLDDAVSLERDGQGNWVLGVHIADVSHYVQAGSPLDLEAWERGTSVYFADQVIPMLPPALSNGICSLNPRVDRLTLSCIMTITPAGEIVNHTIAKSVIRTAYRMTYRDCNLLLAEADPALAEQYAPILPILRDMAALAGVLARRRRLRGSLNLETSECAVLCNEAGAPVDIIARQPGVSEGLIESFMLAANECVARHLNKLDKPAVYRVHEKPSLDKTEALRTMLAPLGYDLRQADNFSLQKLLDAAEGTPEAPAVSMLVLRSMRKARYDIQNLGHFGLAAEYYCHFTSPIRRYPDLMIHRILTALLEGRLEGQQARKLAIAAQRAAAQSSQREIAAQSAEREIEKLYMAEFMAGHIGEEFSAAVSGVTRFGLFAVLPNGVEGLLPVEALPQGRYHYDEPHMTLTNTHTGQVFSFGMALQVVCAAANPATGQIDFRLAGGPEQPPVSRRAAVKERPLPRRKEKSRRAMHVPKGRKGRKRR